MASIYKTPEGTWRVQIARKGVRASGTFGTKKAAELWAVERENEILKGTYRGAGSRTVADASRCRKALSCERQVVLHEVRRWLI